jgi:hypothetical protein
MIPDVAPLSGVCSGFGWRTGFERSSGEWLEVA